MKVLKVFNLFFFFQIYIWQLKDRDLVGVAFIDIPVYVHRLLTVKNLIYGSDICKSVFILRFQDENRTLSLVSKVSKACPFVERSFLHCAQRPCHLEPFNSFRIRSRCTFTPSNSWWIIPIWDSSPRMQRRTWS